jgi:hypothetical protein
MASLRIIINGFLDCGTVGCEGDDSAFNISNLQRFHPPLVDASCIVVDVRIPAPTRSRTNGIRHKSAIRIAEIGLAVEFRVPHRSSRPLNTDPLRRNVAKGTGTLHGERSEVSIFVLNLF